MQVRDINHYSRFAEISSFLKNWSEKMLDLAFAHDGPAAPYSNSDADSASEPGKWHPAKTFGFVVATSLLGWFVLLAPVYPVFARF